MMIAVSFCRFAVFIPHEWDYFPNFDICFSVTFFVLQHYLLRLKDKKPSNQSNFGSVRFLPSFFSWRWFFCSFILLFVCCISVVFILPIVFANKMLWILESGSLFYKEQKFKRRFSSQEQMRGQVNDISFFLYLLPHAYIFELQKTKFPEAIL